MEVEEALDILAHVEFDGFEIESWDSGGSVYYALTTKCHFGTHSDITFTFAAPAPLMERITREQFLAYVWCDFRYVALHEAGERFKVNGEIPFYPSHMPSRMPRHRGNHISLEELQEIWDYGAVGRAEYPGNKEFRQDVNEFRMIYGKPEKTNA